MILILVFTLFGYFLYLAYLSLSKAGNKQEENKKKKIK